MSNIVNFLVADVQIQKPSHDTGANIRITTDRRISGSAAVSRQSGTDQFLVIGRRTKRHNHRGRIQIGNRPPARPVNKTKSPPAPAELTARTNYGADETAFPGT
ncbi:Hypothetical protein NTJ_01859 [Nesidiocoris tenuis]|uniref:Uncharacterized protein n=1 Tax=Nesidiocoris tenuis TaxID=355587 RepID=A0ABN7A9R1_9HEMI|nr:Hypothetical protein NTJ_01859 [Nesidiocoris tenuis]